MANLTHLFHEVLGSTAFGQKRIDIKDAYMSNAHPNKKCADPCMRQISFEANTIRI